MTSLIILSLFISGLTTTQPFYPNASHKRLLPAYKTPGELQKDSANQLNTFRTAHPELYGITVAPPSGFMMYPEFMTVDAMYISYDDYFRDYYVDVIGAAANEVTVYVLVSGSAWQNEANTVLSAQLTAQQMANVQFIDLSSTDYYQFTSPPGDSAVDSIWTVDYGPYYVLNSTGERAIVDPRYYPDRINDDSIPTKLGALDSMNVYRADLFVEGGNLLSDGLGTCYTTTMLQEENTKYTVTELNEVLNNYFGCSNVVYLQPLSGEGTGHIDMFSILLNENTFVVGSFTQAQDATNRTIMDQNAALLEGLTNANGDPITVIRIPMPDPDYDTYGRIWRTYTNGLRLNASYLIPVYSDDTTWQAQVISDLSTALPGVNFVPVASEDVIVWGGAIHCTTRSRPAGTAYSTEPGPGYLCGGSYTCDDCTDDCTLNETGCNTDGSRWVCGQADSDTCLDRIRIECPETMACVDGTCGGDDCTDDCTIGDTGCSDNSTRYICTEGGDGDSCMDFVDFECGTGRECTEGLCLPPNGACGDLTYDGECQGTWSVYCDEGELIYYDCAEEGMVCGFISGEGYYDCMAPTACTDDCVPGETSCSNDTSEVLVCAEAFDGDNCWDWKPQACEDGFTCQDGACVEDCTDECVEGEVGCSEDIDASWACVEAENGCLERVETLCVGSTTCEEGVCVEEKSSSDGCSCSTPTDTRSSVPVFFIMAVIGLALVKRRFV
ncbi:agmatine deiminase family protein [Myxococcota bacterium]|nr:agmatine deiminase family protein [Myxococcota bacterium]MBU1380220.1 agmatine deiminase family protein [Myxococcota bacterium]MBU1499086.1 agmatine deiminase family protein [Myxococcota bacterium]